MHIEHQLIDPPSLSQICASPRSPPLELTLEEELASLPTQNDSSLISELGTNIPVLLAPDSPDSDFDDFEVQFEEMNVRSARSRAQHRERVARRYESMCNARVRFLKEQAAQALVLAEMSAAATRQPVNNPTFFNVFGASLPGPISVSSSPKPSPVMFQSAPLTRMSSPSPYTVCGETVDLASVPPTDCASGSFDSRSVVDRILASLDHFDLDDISIDGLSETECRRLRTESRRRRRLDRSRVFELGVLLELKRRQIGRSRSSSSSSGSSVSCTSSDSEVEPASPPCTPLAVQTMNHLVAKMVLKRRETAQKQFSTAAASREIFESRGCSSLRVAISPVDTAMPTIQARRRSHSRNRLASDFFSLSRSILGSNDSSWLREKRRLASLDLEQ
ncbi:hypothetical protein BDV93DRAFT_528418 [Ceratobasidium sp. AG-I]|nr:hypothetical protein BDV93DRAFT_528418 [Ceratobasidium sp. AG-I]